MRYTVIILSVFFATPAFATDARNYILMPEGSDVTEGRLTYSEITSPSTHTDNQTELLRHTHYFNIGSDLAAIGLIVPYTSLKQQSTRTNGYGDPVLMFAWGMYNMPALTPQQYALHDKNGWTSACAVFVTLPVGAYNSNNMLNTGGNRYTEKSECQAGWAHNGLLLEMVGGFTHYGDNNDYYHGNVLAQDNLYHFETHSSYKFTPRIWASLDTFYLHGGDVSLNNHDLNLQQNALSTGTIIRYAFDKHQYLRLLYQDTIMATNTSNKVNSITLSYIYLW
ncbi:transporter [Sulfuriferula nivalis]|uniref:Transporter n=1 Tax=Sulfuriferula nivalis TaxID=2675298 RepID=A0A809REL4_9PROT|nr:transporter [Sulfuriferula nivalis]BBP00219.1 hypothetical protein SFSGTM_09270 [Sulfuriferula nivalis]